MKAKLILEVHPGGKVKIKGVTDLQGRALSPAKCRSAVLAAGQALGKADPATLKPVAHQAAVAQAQELKLGQ